MAAPRVTVLMTTYNGAALIGESIASILAQTYTDFELLVVDDASTDTTRAVVEGFADPRIRLLALPENRGIVEARNIGFAAARGTYVAALDHDDLSDPERLALQVAYLDAHPQTVLVATGVRLLSQGRLRASPYTTGGDALAIRWQMLIDNPLGWSSVMFRADAVRGLGVFMRGEFELADDFDLHHRLLAVGDIVRLDAVLMTYRYHETNASRLRRAGMARAAARVLAYAYQPWLGARAAQAAELLTSMPPKDAASLREVGVLLEELLARFCDSHVSQASDRARIARLAGETWWRCVGEVMRSGRPWAILAYWRAPVLSAAFAPPPRKALRSFAVGMVRAVFPRV